MKKFGVPKVVLVVLGSFAALLLVLVVVVSVVFSLPWARDLLSRKIEEATGLRVESKFFNYSPWKGAELHQIRLIYQQTPVLAAEGAKVRLDLGALVGGRVSVEKLELEKPQLRVFSRKPGRVDMPEPARTEVMGEAGQTSPLSRIPLGAEEGVVRGAAVEDAGGPGLKAENLGFGETSSRVLNPKEVPVEVKLARVREGRIVWLDADGNISLEITGVNATGRLNEGLMVEGQGMAGELVLRQAVRFRNVQTKFSRDDGRWEFREAVGEFAGGEARGRGSVSERGGKYEAEVAVHGGELSRLLEDAGLPGGMVSGNFHGEVRIAAGGDRGAETSGWAEVRECGFVPVPLLRQLGDILRVRELSHPRIERGRIEFESSEQILRLKRVVAEAGDTRLVGAGTVDLSSGGMEIPARFLVHERVLNRLGVFAPPTQEEPEHPGFRGVSFRIHGTVKQPRTDLLERMAGEKVGREAERMLRGFFGIPDRRQPEGGERSNP